MFDNDRYVSKGIQQTIPLELQSFMWNSIDKLKAQKYDLDYLLNISINQVKSRRYIPSTDYS